MKNKHWKAVLFLLILFTLNIFANDGAYTLSGNQLIPMKESKISIKKEVLTITRLNDDTLDVKVEYRFFNPTKAKKVLVGFEAAEPDGDVQSESKNGEHPYMKKFSVIINGKRVAYKVSGGINGTDFGYVYSFQANFNKGINYITHHYRYEPSSSTGVYYEIDYILSAASRWANGVIENFTLIIDVGEYERVSIAKTFFKKASQWEFDGVSKDIVSSVDFEKGGIRFYIRKGALTFKKKNFKPTKELYLLALRGTPNAPFYIENFNYKKDKLPFKIDGMYIEDILPKDKMSYKIFKNLPYARRGYIFKNKTIQNYYESLEWYREKPNYIPKWSDLIKEENEWTTKLRKQSLELLKNLPFAKRGYVFKKAYLQNYFKHQYWYTPNKSYKVVLSELSAHEKKWLQEIKKLKVTDSFDLYEWIDKYPKF